MTALHAPQVWRLLARRLAWAVGFGVLLVLAGVAWQDGGLAASAQVGPAPGSTLPPGTLPPPLRSRVIVVHAASFAADIEQTAVDICTEENEVVSGLNDLVYGASATVVVEADLFDWKVATAGSNCTAFVADIAPFGLTYAVEKLLVFSGDGTNQPLGVIQYTLQPGGTLFLPQIGRR